MGVSTNLLKGMVRAHTKVVQGRSVYVPAHRRIDHGTLPRARMSHNPSMAKTPEELASRFGPEADRFHLRDHEDKPLLVRRFGRGKKHAFAVHAGDGTHVASLHVQAGPQGAQVTAGWTHDAHHGNGAHNALLRRLVSHHGTVTSPTSMHHDLHRSFNTMDDDHELSTERSEGGGGVRYRLQRKQATLFKGLRVRLSKAFADPFPGRTSTGPKLTLPELIRAIRLAVTQEQEAIATYSAQADASPDPDAARVLRGIADEERVHTGELIHLLKLLAGEGEHLREGETEAMGTLKVRIAKALLPLLKGRVKGHWRQTSEGKMVWVSDYTDKRTKKPQQAHVGPQSSLFDERPAQPPKPVQPDLFGVPQAPAQPKPAPPPPSTASGPDLTLTVQTAKPTPDAAQTRKQFRDTGEKIGGARKDIQAARKRFEDELTASALADLEQQDPDAAARSVKKTVLWPKPDINAWREEGRDPRWVALARVLWDTVSAKPKVDTPAGRAAYHTGIDILREAVDSSADYDDLKAKLNGLAQTYRNVVAHTNANSIRQRRGQPSAPPLDQYELAVGAAILSLGNTGDWLRNYKRVKSNGLKGWLYNLDEIWPHRSEENLWSGIHEIWTDWRKATRTSTHRPKPEDLWRPSAPSEYERLGNPEPIDVHDASVFIDLFGVRGVEFGNWMDDAAASVHVNRAAEALADLADGLGIDRKQVSVNGRLALAFGARGSGPFLAHYEPGKVVINLTKLGGAGSLAHEWAHFLDHMIGKLELGLPAGHATEMGMGPVMPDDPPVVAALRRVMNTIYTGKPDGTWQRSEFFEVSAKRGEYWRKPWELFARAFECYVVDALAEKGRGNNYLAYDKSLKSPKAPYPRDKEREALKEAFDGLIEAIRQTGTLRKALRLLG